jgi:hypothetical protein
MVRYIFLFLAIVVCGYFLLVGSNDSTPASEGIDENSRDETRMKLSNGGATLPRLGVNTGSQQSTGATTVLKPMVVATGTQTSSRKSSLDTIKGLGMSGELVNFDFEREVSKLELLKQKVSSNDTEALVSLSLIGAKCREYRTNNARFQVERAVSQDAEKFDRDRAKNQSICQNIPAEILAARVEFMGRAASLGSVFATVSFMQMLNDSVRYDPTWVWQNAGDIQRLREQAVNFTEVAMKSGIAESYIHMYQAYSSNGFFQRDNITAMAYLDLLANGLSESEANEDRYFLKERKASLLSLMSEADVRQAQIKAVEINARLQN